MLQKATASTLAQSILTASQYAVELNSRSLETLQKHLAEISAQVEGCCLPEEFDKIHGSFRGELRLYRDESVREVSRMRAEMAAAAAVMQTLAEDVASTGTGHEERLRKEVNRLHEAAQQDDLAQIRTVIASVEQEVLKSCADIQQAHRVMVAQLQDEIRALHMEVERERRAGLTDPETGAWNRGKLDTRIRDLALADQPFCVFFMGVSNRPKVLARHPETRLTEALKAMLGRLGTVVGDDGVAGRWNEDVFAVIFDVPLSVAPVTVRELQVRLGGQYAIQEGGDHYLLDLTVRVATVERHKGSSETEFYPRLGQAAISIVMS